MSIVTALQLVSVPDLKANLAAVERQLADLAPAQRLVVLPECFAFFGGKDKQQLTVAEPFGAGPIQDALKALCVKYGVWMVSGTFPILSANPERFSAASLVIDDQGQVRGRFDKMHMFDVQVADATGTYLESAVTVPGKGPTVVDSPFGRIGMAVCYDVRFAELFAWYRQQDVKLLVLPAAFTARTGEAHWQVLCRARAIEGQCYLVAANQGGTHANGRETWGRSLIVDPWGEVLEEMELGEGSVSAALDHQITEAVRSRMPMDKHRRFAIVPPKES
ncbi:carbon-nitrogen hydrolase family protein [Gallaecimonas kandeliae]|uniref:carbon-nitrogen hydrolase family protein n=1 Tax=Gallaecimonas kandeliae TaxID=3029055 RepID=UPI0026478662|nr:carbon-nitrogen hydrolase family protein [Gallaecimonas kandeliae]WKE66034.1 carbon-nitrogen hydrolase family protein [Gallaecimonas kandeliae]